MSSDLRNLHAKPHARPGLKLKDMDEKNMHNLFLKNMSGLIEETKKPSNFSNSWVWVHVFDWISCEKAFSAHLA